MPRALEELLPGLGADVDVDRAPDPVVGRTRTPPLKKRTRALPAFLHQHVRASIPEFCRVRFLPHLPYRRTLTYNASVPYESLLAFFD